MPRVFKQTLCSGGGNLTNKHIEDVSLCALFLMEASKKADKLFNIAPPTTAHTIADSAKDVAKLVNHLHEAKVTTVDNNRTTPIFPDPVASGWQKLSTTDWLKNALSRDLAEEGSDLEERVGEINLDYEIANVT